MTARRTLSGIDVSAPGGLEALFAWHRSRFGDLRMDGTATPPADPAPPAPQGDPAPTPPADPKPTDPLGDAGKKAIADERKARKDADARAAAAEARVKEFEDAKLSERERADKELADAKAAAAEAKAEAAKFQHDALRHRIAAEKSVPVELLAGATEEDLVASAEKAIAWRGAATPEPPKAPKPDPSVGPRGEQVTSGDELYRQKHPPQRTPA